MGRHEVGHIDNSMKIPLNNGAGCRFEGQFSINKVPGNFHVSTHSATAQPQNPDMTHVIHKLSFGDTLQVQNVHGAFNALGGADRLTSNPLASHDYILKIVPTVYEDKSGKQRYSYQYTVANKEYVAYSHTGRIIPAIWFRYDLSPITVKYTERRQPLYRFITTVCISQDSVTEKTAPCPAGLRGPSHQLPFCDSPHPCVATALVFSSTAPVCLPPPASDGTPIHYLFPHSGPFPQAFQAMLTARGKVNEQFAGTREPWADVKSSLSGQRMEITSSLDLCHYRWDLHCCRHSGLLYLHSLGGLEEDPAGQNALTTRRPNGRGPRETASPASGPPSPPALLSGPGSGCIPKWGWGEAGGGSRFRSYLFSPSLI
ncbi:endoplasmic reticulum-Golgi intermediate compartment protein 1 isoform X1 [Herpailurus yagouaroundi]|uniref:endoplasmic reticulum-Golgi intermediate compartment protein 1 isoform X1 n=1 Tax=Herpailurus yagouaroundi TaxID=1608482 RepID=UPI001AD6A185|nr:endoplasmic reticulum-Golgi intermediate compartment protein 1 isoform X1 [Puma yagouaroundi]